MTAMQDSRLRWATAAAFIVATVSVTGCAATETPGAQTTSSPAADSGGDVATSTESAAADYCESSGGEVQSRQPMYGTNNDPSVWIPFGDPVDVCRFQTLDGDDSRIYVDLETLYSEQPTLAALAYLAKEPLESRPQGNPATALCTQLGGAVSYGPSANGGGMVNEDDPIDIVFASCTFADQSFIDEWGIAYYAEDTVRGVDLSELFRFDASQAPDVFAS